MGFLPRILLLLALFSGIHTGLCQDSYLVKWYSADSNHLPQNTVKSIIKDKHNYIWLSTESGLVRFDGKNFDLFNTSNIKGLKSERMGVFGGSVAGDSIFIRNDLRQYYVIHNRNVLKSQYDLKPLIKPIRGYVFDNAEIIPELHYEAWHEIFKVSSGGISYVIGNDSIRVYNSNNELQEKYSYTFNDSVQYFSKSGKLYRVQNKKDYQEVYKDSVVTKKFNIPEKNNFTIYTNETANQLFLITGTNVYLLEDKNNGFNATLLYNGFNANDNIKAVYYDRKNSLLYMGSHNKGLMVVRRQEFKTMISPFKLTKGVDGVYYGLTAYEGDKILAATGDIFKDGKYIGGIGINNTSDKFTIVTDDNNDIWVKGNMYLYRFTKESAFKKYESWKFNDRVTTVYKDINGLIWVGTAYPDSGKEPGSIYVLNPNEENCTPELYMKLKMGPRSFIVTEQGQLWAGCRDGMYRIDIKQKKVHEVTDFEGTYVRYIYNAGKGELWIATYNKGLFLYKDGKITNFPPDKNKYILTAHCIIDDKKGFFWISTNTGLFYVSRQELLNYAAGKKDNIYYYHYNKDYGFKTNEFNGGCEPCGVYLNNETMYFPSMYGITYFNPGELQFSHPDNNMYIDKVEVDNSILKTDKLTLDRNFGRVSFFISSPFYGNEDNQYIQTMLTGPVEHEWTPLTDDHITFSTLPPGNYNLSVRKLAGFNSGYQYSRISFFVQPAFWQTLWFKVLVAIAGSLLLLLIFRARMRYINRQNIILEEQVASRTRQLSETIKTLQETENDLYTQNENHISLIKTITHDIKSPLRFMTITGRYIYNNLDEKNQSLKDDVESIYTSSSQLYHFVDSFLEYTKETDAAIKQEPCSIYKLAEEKVSLFKNIAASKNTRFVNSIDENSTATVNKNLLAILIHNLLDNAVKNTSNGTITLEGYTNETNTIIIISDTGSGMPETQTAYYNSLFEGTIHEDEKNSTGMGLTIIAELIVKIGAKVKISSALNKGTQVTILLSKPSAAV